MKKIETQNARKAVFMAAVAVSFIAILMYNFFTPLMSDDLLIDSSAYNSIWDIFAAEYQQYMTWNGRSVLQIIMRIFTLLPKYVFNIMNSLCFVALMLLIYLNTVGKKKYNTILYIIINLLAWNFSVEFDQTVLWLAGACNYLWGSAIIMGLVTFYRYLVEGKRAVKHSNLLCVGLTVWGLLAGWCNENTSGGGILLILAMTAFYFYENKKVQPYMPFTIGGMITGFLFMICSPGARIRAGFAMMSETHSGIMVYVSRFLKINICVNQYMMVYIVAIILLMTWYLYKKKNLWEIRHVILFSIAGLATCYALILSPEPMPRAYYGANIFFLTACVEMLNIVVWEENLHVLETGAAIAGLVWMSLVYIANGADLARINREVNERERYIYEQIENGNYDLKLPMISRQFENEYSFIFENDISDEENWYINSVYKIKYHLNSVMGVPAEEWKP
ncbi:MAG: hypothetical protein HDQ99_16740 [Lachnospiraceae bacterium]|nr:hypothetical protein [Lachnospiraceae bacterium]